MTTGRTLKTGDVIKSLNLVEIRRQQRRVTTLLNGDHKDAPLLSYRQGDGSSYRGENLGTRRWPPGGGIHQKTNQTDLNEGESFWDHFDNPSTKREQLKTTKDNRLHRLNNSPNDEPTSSTPLPPINSHKTNCARRQSPGSARKKVDRRPRQVSPAAEQSIPRNSHLTRNRKSSNKPRNKSSSSKPVVKYQHQKVEPSAEERYRKYRQVTIDGVRKVTSCTTPEVWLRSDSGLSSVSDVSALRRRHVQFQGDDEEGNKQRTSMLNLSSAGWGASDANQLSIGLEGLRGSVGGRTPGLGSTERGNTNEDHFNADGLTLEDSGRCHPTPVADGSAWKDEPSVRLPDIQICNSSRPLLLPETRRFNPDIGETSRAFVFSYFNHLPPVVRSGDEDLGSDRENQSKSINVVHAKTSTRKK